MPIKFKCQCGKLLQAKDEMAGKRVKCPACGKILLIPAELRLQAAEPPQPPVSPEPAPAPSDAVPESKCPQCGEAMAPDVVLCVNCGFNAQTGFRPDSATSAPKAKSKQSIVLPTKKIMIVAVIIAVIVVGWFVVLAPLFAGLEIDRAYSYVESGDLQKAITEFNALRPKVDWEQQQRIDLWINQMELELQKNTGRTLTQGETIKSDTVAMEVGKGGFSGGALLAKTTIRNNGKTPLTLKNDHFYLRGLQDIVPVADSTKNSLDGVVVQPGESSKGVVVFRRIPKTPVTISTGRFTDTRYYMFFNDGKLYVKRMLPF